MTKIFACGARLQGANAILCGQNYKNFRLRRQITRGKRDFWHPNLRKFSHVFETYRIVSIGNLYFSKGYLNLVTSHSDVLQLKHFPLDGFKLLSNKEGIIPALETAHAIAHVAKLAPKMDKDAVIVVCLSGRGDKDVNQVADRMEMGL